MKIGVTSQNFRTITGHAGKARRFLRYLVDERGITEIERLDLPREMSMHEFSGSGAHPIDDLDILITGGCGDGFVRKMERRGIAVIVTGEESPLRAVMLLLAAGEQSLAPAAPHDHGHEHHHEHGHGEGGCGCGGHH